MSKVSVVYWSQSGNTQAMAEAVAAGITEAGKEAEVVYVSDVNVADLTAEKAFALGCPAMGAEVLEEGEFEPFMESIDGSISGNRSKRRGLNLPGDTGRCNDRGVQKSRQGAGSKRLRTLKQKDSP